MTVFVWLNEDGQWQVTHLPPADGFAALRVIADGEPMFFTHPDVEPVEIAIT
ncbi:hypothetical protein STRZYGA_00350 [Brevundimonas phage vB_BpoS-Strzyga]|nr:hypothetical protein STRZYGA_00350 [Brevundimonas phage vB_BpoS-Strzyga]